MEFWGEGKTKQTSKAYSVPDKVNVMKKIQSGRIESVKGVISYNRECLTDKVIVEQKLTETEGSRHKISERKIF